MSSRNRIIIPGQETAELQDLREKHKALATEYRKVCMANEAIRKVLAAVVHRYGEEDAVLVSQAEVDAIDCRHLQSSVDAGMVCVRYSAIIAPSA